MMNSPPSTGGAVCPACGAAFSNKEECCWLCGAAIQRPVVADLVEPPPVRLAVAPPPVSGGHGMPVQFGLSSLMLAVTLAAVLCGVFSLSPGLGVALCILSAPALIRTYLVVYRLKEKGQRVSATEKAGMYLGSVVVVWIIIVVILTASFGTFFVVCLGQFAVLERHLPSNEGLIAMVLLFSGLAALGVTGLVSWSMFLWVRSRWRKAIGEPERRPPDRG